jgi:hypothetical protein
MDPENPALAQLINEELPSEDLDAVRKQTGKMVDYFTTIAATSTSFEVRKLKKGLPHFQLILTEETALVLQYMFSRGTADCPLQQFPGGSELHHAFRREFEALWAFNAKP